jgi:rare lipoprotein A
MENFYTKVINPWLLIIVLSLSCFTINEVSSGLVDARIYARDLALAQSTLNDAEKTMLRMGLKRSHNVRYSRASWYGKYFHGRQTATQELFNRHLVTAAHKTLPLGTFLLVTNLNNQEQIVVRVNDRGPYVRGREIDLSEGAAKLLGSHDGGVIAVRYEVLVEA